MLKAIEHFADDVPCIAVGGWVATLLVAGFTAVQVRNMVKTELLPAEPVAKAAPFTNTELFAWTSVMLLTFGMAVRYPTALGPVATTAAPFLLAATVVGYLVGTRYLSFLYIFCAVITMQDCLVDSL